MLQRLAIKNIALIDDIELSLFAGLNILSGETGAGKSIIIDSLNFVLGERADKSLIRHGEQSAVVEAVFEGYLNQKISDFLSNNGIEVEDILIVRRTMTHEGKNECRINGRLVTLGILKGLTSLLADIHGQHEHQALLNPETHIELLDSFGHKEITPFKAAVAEKYGIYAATKRELKSIGNSAERERKLDILSFQIEEITETAIQEGEEDELIAERKRFLNIGKIADGVERASSLLSGDNASIISSLNSAISALNSVSDFDKELETLSERLSECKIELKDISESVSDIAGSLDFDENTAEKIEKRLTKVRNILKKYGGSYEELQKFLESAQSEHTMLSNAAERVQELESALKKQAEQLVIALSKLTKARKTAAEAFEEAISKELADLGMKNTDFKVFFKEISDDEILDAATENGCDSVEFLISPNLGEPLKPLAKIISGGEMSRFMLALKNITAELDGINTMVFDEIDTGISGKIAEVVAEKLYNISVKRQVIAVTHLPQLASMADFHFLISKEVENNKTLTKLTVLDEESSISEISRLVGGKEHSEYSLLHAKSMKEFALKYKKSIK